MLIDLTLKLTRKMLFDAFLIKNEALVGHAGTHFDVMDKEFPLIYTERKGISILGLFIALLGLQNAGIVVPSGSTCVDLASFNLLTQNWGDIMPMVVTVFTFLAIVIMSHKNIRGAVLIGIIGGMGLYYLLGLTVEGFYETLQISFASPYEAFGEFTSQSLLLS